MRAAPRIGMLVQRRAVEAREGQASRGKCAGTQSRITPIAVPVQPVDEARKSSGVPKREVGAK